jgi:teichuronic acid biosynthesis glycosyltransferase TuaG
MDTNIVDNNLLLSILMPAYNVERYIQESIKSILNQDYEKFELIIIDDASTDNTALLISEFQDHRIRFYRNTNNLGVSQNRNLLLNYANGQLISFFDSDDISSSTRFSKQINYLNKFPEIDLVFCKVKFIDELGNNIHFRKNDFVLKNSEISSELLFNNVLSTSTVVFKSELKSLMINHSVSFIAEDYYLWAILFINKKKFACINKQLVKYRVRDSGSTNKYIKNLKSSLDVIHKLLLENLGFSVTKEILDIHNSLYTFDINSTSKYITWLLTENEQLYNDIFYNNEIKKIYDETYLKKSIKRNWYLKCRTASKYINYNAVKIYNNSSHSNFYYNVLILIYIIYHKLKKNRIWQKKQC